MLAIAHTALTWPLPFTPALANGNPGKISNESMSSRIEVVGGKPFPPLDIN